MNISHLRESTASQYQRQNPLAQKDLKLALKGLQHWADQTSLGRQQFKAFLTRQFKALGFFKNDPAQFVQSVQTHLGKNSIQTVEDAVLALILAKAFKTKQNTWSQAYQTATQSHNLSEIKQEVFGFKGKISSIDELMSLAFMASQLPEGFGVEDLLEINGPNTQLSDLKEMARNGSVSLQNFLSVYIETAKKHFAGFSKSQGVDQPSADQVAVQNIYDQYLISGQSNLRNLVAAQFNFESAVPEVLEKDRQERLVIDRETEKKVEAERQKRQIKNRTLDLKQAEDLAEVRQRQSQWSPVRYEQERQKILDRISSQKESLII